MHGSGGRDASGVLARELVWFDAVARHEHLGRAAAELGVEQSTLSRALERWERGLDLPLVDRAGRRIALTRHGAALAEVATRALQVLDDRGTTTSVALGFLNTLGPQVVPDLLRAWSAHRAPVPITLRQGGAGELVAALGRGEIDLALTSPPPDAPGIVWTALFTEPLRLVVAAGHPLAGAREPVTLAAVEADPLLTLAPGYGLRDATDDLCARAGTRPRIGFESTDTGTLRGLVSAGFGVAVLPPAAEPGTDVRELALADPAATRTIVLATSATRHAPASVTAVADYVRTHLTSDPRH